MRWMEGMSQSAARRQLRKRLVFTFLLKEIVGILLLRAWEQRREHAEWRPSHTSLCLEMGGRASPKASWSTERLCEPGLVPLPLWASAFWYLTPDDATNLASWHTVGLH